MTKTHLGDKFCSPSECFTLLTISDFRLHVAILEKYLFLKLMYTFISCLTLIRFERGKKIKLYFGGRAELLAFYPFPHLFAQI